MKRGQHRVFKPPRRSTGGASGTRAGRSRYSRDLRLRLESLEARLLLATDFGDAPLPYPTTLAENGARHEAIGPTLGSGRDMEVDGTHSAAADAEGTDDDGMTFGLIRVGQLGATASVNVQNAPSGARLDAWIDFNADGSWGGPGEQIASSTPVANGDNTIRFDVPSWAANAQTFSRFRLSTAGNLAVRGSAVDGEVEDYAVPILPPAATTGMFGGQKTINAAADGVHSVFAADVDGDGDLDVLSASQNDDKIAWYENDGSQTFSARTITAAADGAAAVIAGDLDGDGDMDILSASYLGDSVDWYENNGNQGFTAHTISASADGAVSVFAADVDGDGDSDVLSASGNNNRIAWHENNGSQEFTTRTISTTADFAHSVFAADVDRDGDMDVLSASFRDDKIAWYENNGSQVFVARTISTAADGAHSVFAADVDDDGDTDVLSASDIDGKIAWYENNGSQTFTARTISTTANGAWTVFAADADGDGDVDVLSASSNDDKIAWYENDGSQAFTTRTITTAADGARSMFAADMDGDGDLDVLSASFSGDMIAWYENENALCASCADAYIVDEDTALVVDAAAGVLANDTPQAGEVLSASVVTAPTHGVLTLAADGSFRFTPDANFHGADTFRYNVASNQRPARTAQVTITINPVPDAPMAVDDAYTAESGITLQVTSPVVVDPTPVDVTFFQFNSTWDYLHPTNGQDPAGVDADFNTTWQLGGPTYNGPAFTPGTAVFGYGSVDCCPIATNIGVPQPGLRYTAYFRRTFDLADDPAQVTALTAEVLADDGAVIYLNGQRMGAINMPGGSSEDYFALTGNPGSEFETFSIALDPAALVAGTNVLAVSVHNTDTFSSDLGFDLRLDARITPEPEIAGVLANDTDAEGDSLFVELIAPPANGSLTLNPDGTFEYTSDAGFVGVDTFQYRASDDDLPSNVATVTINVEPAMNRPPDAVDDAYTVDEDAVLTIDAAGGVLANDMDFEQHPITAIVVATPQHGGLSLSADGSFTYTPNENYFGADSFTYRANDGFDESRVATVAITVGGLPDAPVAVDDAYSTDEGLPLMVNAAPGTPTTPPGSSTLLPFSGGELFYDTLRHRLYATATGEIRRYDVTSGQTLSPFTVPATLVAGDITPNQGNLYFIDGRTEPGVGFLQKVDLDNGAITQLSFGRGSFEEGGEALFINAAGIAAFHTSFAGSGDTPLRLLDTNTDTQLADSGRFWEGVTFHSGPDKRTLLVINHGLSNGGLGTLDGLTFTGLGGFETGSFNGGVVGAVNRDSTLVAVNCCGGIFIGSRSMQQIRTLTGLSLPMAFDPARDTFYATDPSRDELVALDTGTWQEQFRIPIREDVNGSGSMIVSSNSQVVFMTTPAGVRMINVASEAPQRGVLANDTDADGDVLTAVLISDVANGTLDLNDDGSFTYTPDVGFIGDDSFTYVANDDGLDSNVATVTITVRDANVPPVAVDDTYSIDEDIPLSVDAASGVLANDSDFENVPLTAVLDNGPDNGTLNLAADGSFTYTPDAHYFGTDTFTYRARDNEVNSPPATVTITINPVPDAPVAVDDAYTAESGIALQVTSPVIVDPTPVDVTLVPSNSTWDYLHPLNGQDPASVDADFNTTWQIGGAEYDGPAFVAGAGILGYGGIAYGPIVTDIGTPPEGSRYTAYFRRTFDLSAGPASVTSLTAEILADDGAVIYLNGVQVALLNMPGGSNGTYFDTTGGNVGSEDQTSTITLDPSALVAGTNVLAVSVHNIDPSFSTDLGFDLRLDARITPEPEIAGVLANDTDAEGDSLFVELIAPPANGSLTLNPDGTFEYTSNAGFVGVDTFQYRASDDDLPSNVATVTINVEPAMNRPPDAVDDAYSVDEDAVLTVDAAAGVLANDTDFEQHPITAVVVATPQHGSLSLAADGSFTYTPDANYSGDDVFTYRATDGFDDSRVATVTITVRALADAPVAVDDAYSVDEGETLNQTFDLPANTPDITWALWPPTAGGSGQAYAAVLQVRTWDEALAAAAAMRLSDEPGRLATITSAAERDFIAASFALVPNTDFWIGGFQDIASPEYSEPSGGWRWITEEPWGFTAWDTGQPNQAGNQQCLQTYFSLSAWNDLECDSQLPGFVVEFSAKLGVLANDFDADGDMLTAVLIADVAHGELTFNANGSFTYTPDIGFIGEDSFTYVANDDGLDSNIATVTITVRDVNAVPQTMPTAYAWMRIPARRD